MSTSRPTSMTGYPASPTTATIPEDSNDDGTMFNDDPDPDASQERWIAIEPPTPTTRLGSSSNLRARRDSVTLVRGNATAGASNSIAPPSFRDSQFDVILRRQRYRPPDNSGLKDYAVVPSRFINLPNSFEFAGWGSIQRIKLSSEDFQEAENRLKTVEKERVLGQFTAAALAGNAVLGSVFYAFPAVVVVAGAYSPISLFVATLILFLWRPMMQELASALPISGAPYTYFLNVSTKPVALVSATLLLLDYASTSIVSAATAAAYIAGEVLALPFPTWILAAMVLVLFTVVSLLGVRESARIALAVLSLHVLTMVSLIIASAVHWGRTGNDQWKANWQQSQRENAADGGIGILRQLYHGVCIGMLGLTGFECTPSYISRIKPGKFPLVLRNLHLPAIVFNTLLMTLVMAIVPLDVTRGGANILSVLGEMAAGKWLRIWVVVDAFVVLCGGVLTGILSACELLQRLSQDRILPQAFLKLTRKTNSPYVSVLSFIAFCAIVYATTGARLAVVSEMFSLVWLVVMTLFPLSLLLLRFNRGRLGRSSRARLPVLFFSLFIVCPVILGGNIALNPRTAGYFAIYTISLLLLLAVTQNKVRVLRWIYWVYDQWCNVVQADSNAAVLSTPGGGGSDDEVDAHGSVTLPPLGNQVVGRNRVGSGLMKLMTRLKRQVVCVCAKGDEINTLFHMILYAKRNEETSHLKIIHFYEEEKGGIPSELEANAKILDEAFPEITIDLVRLFPSSPS
ncbi:amino acid permease [Coprinopsis cinerea okayama7|uniref:Amino acid permease n=1 Tax=Coprinopsis cinerea (strain Okayama-7 / 130 / ATCC MYA-4618 / FGSC 9003) TaxID=240176 RepID=A8NBJ2_COPC7|nr:amino acid permease [Coprinopsis cinerea okayama7\|eukprot:XP_001832190.2 amino acid permease [Coprinopsis cinerea okayama7\